MLQIETTKDELGRNWYSFESRGTKYDVVKDSDGRFSVWSDRLSRAGGSVLNVLSRKEFSKRAKVFSDLLILIDSDNVEDKFSEKLN